MRKLTLFFAMGLAMIFSLGANAGTKQVYTTYDPDGGHILTFYYDDADLSLIPDVNKPEVYDPTSATPRFAGYADKIKHAVIDKSMKDWKPTSLARMFYGNGNANKLVNLEDITGWENLNTSNVTSLFMAFNGCQKLQVIDMGSWDLSKLTGIDNAFLSCYELTTIICNADLSALTSTNPFGACEKLVGGKGTKYASGKYGPEFACPDKGTSAPGYFTPSKKVYTEYIENNNDTLYYRYDNNWYYSENKIEMYEAKEVTRFSGYGNSVKVVVIDESMQAWKTTSLRRFLYGGDQLTNLINVTEIKGLENVNTENVTIMDAAFEWLSSIETLDLSMWDVKNVTRLFWTFSRCSKLKTLDISTWQPAKVENSADMFYLCNELTTIYANYDWDGYTTLTYSPAMFLECPKLVGGQGTKYLSANADKTYARVDDPENSRPGYFTSVIDMINKKKAELKALEDRLEAAKTYVTNIMTNGMAKTELLNTMSGFIGIIQNYQKDLGINNLAAYKTYSQSLDLAQGYYEEVWDDFITATKSISTPQINNLAEEDDSEACKQIIANAIAALDTIGNGRVNKAPDYMAGDMKTSWKLASQIEWDVYNALAAQRKQELTEKKAELLNSYNALASLEVSAETCDISETDRKPIKDAKDAAGTVYSDDAATLQQVKAAITAADDVWDAQNTALLPKAKTNATNLKDEMVDLKNAVSADPFKDVTLADEIQTHIMALVEAQLKTLLSQVSTIYATAKNNLATDIAAALIGAKQWGKETLDAMALPGDNDACKQIIADAKNQVDGITWDNTKSVAENIAAIKAAADKIAKDTQAALEAERNKPAVVAVCDFSNKATKHQAYTDSWTYDASSIGEGKWAISYGANNNYNNGWTYVKFGGKNVNTSKTSTVVNADAFTQDINAIQVTYRAGSLKNASMKLNEWGVNVYSDQALTTKVATIKGDASQITKEDDAVLTLNSVPGTKGYFFEVYWNITNPTGDNGVIVVEKIEFVKKTATDIEVVESQETKVVESTKIIHNGQVVIIRDGVMYNILGGVIEK